MKTNTAPWDYNRRRRYTTDEVWQKFQAASRWYFELRAFYMRGLLSRAEYERMYLEGPKGAV